MIRYSQYGVFKPALATIALFAPLALASSARAASCGDVDCPQGFACEMETAPCAAVDCEGESCAPCAPTTRSVCRPAACESDSDCADGMLCAEFTSEDCAAAGPACTGDDCPASAPEAGSCQSTVEKRCAPRWSLPCAADADCGAGFSCTEREACSCPGSPGTGAGSPGSGSAEPAPPASDGREPAGSGAADAAPSPGDSAGTDGCVCEPTGVKACVRQVVACASDADCVAGWSCADNPEGVCWSSANGEAGCSADPPKVCLPPYSDVAIGDGGGWERPTTASGEGTPNSGSGQEALPDSAPPRTSGGCSISTAGGGSKPGGPWLGLFVAALAVLGFGRRVAGPSRARD